MLMLSRNQNQKETAFSRDKTRIMRRIREHTHSHSHQIQTDEKKWPVEWRDAGFFGETSLRSADNELYRNFVICGELIKINWALVYVELRKMIQL